MARFIVHIGDGKCGSTAIQSALYLSREALAEEGILFDTLFPTGGHTTLPLLLGLKSRSSDPARLTQATEIIDLLRAKEAQYDWIVLSAENFINLDPAEMPRLLSWISDKADEVHVIAYVREPSAMYLSSVQQILKGNHHYVRPELYARRVDKKIAEWQDFFGADNFTLRLFDRNRLIDGNIVSDFGAYLSAVTGKAIGLPDQSSNESMSAEQMQVMQIYRRRVLKDVPGKLVDRSTLLARLFSELNAVHYIGHRPRLTKLAKVTVSYGNRAVVDALNSRFPQLAMPNIALDATPPQPPYPWDANKNVSEILEETDQTIVRRLCTLLPDMNDGTVLKGHDLETVLMSVAGCRPREVDKLCDAYSHYLKRVAKCKPLA